MRHVHHISRPIARCAITVLTLSAASALAAGTMATPAGAQRPAGPAGVDIWFDGGNSLDRGALAPLRYSADPGSHVAIIRVDGDGGFSVLWPTSPNSRSTWQGGQTGTTIPFRADETDGVGYVFAIASRTPFDFRQFRTSSGHWMVSRLASDAGADPFELADRFARAVTGRRGDYSIAYAPYQTGSGDYHIRSAYGDRGGAVYSADDAYGGYGAYSGYDIGVGYGDPWATSRYRRRYSDYRYPASPYPADPRLRYTRHCPDGTLAPYTTACPPAFLGRGRDNRFERGLDRRFDDDRDGVIRGMAGGRQGGLTLRQQRPRSGARPGSHSTGRRDGGSGRGFRPIPHPAPVPVPRRP